MRSWEYEPVPRYFFYLGNSRVGEVIFDGFKRDACNDYNPDGEVWRAIVDGYLVGRFPSLSEAQKAAQAKILNRGGLMLVASKA